MSPAEARAAWVAALRSGRFTQTTGTLERGGRQCCLGVACRVAIENGLPVEVSVSNSFTLFDDTPDDLPESVQKWLGLRTTSGTLGPGEPASLVDANDDLGYNFEQIADLIESHESELIA